MGLSHVDFRFWQILATQVHSNRGLVAILVADTAAAAEHQFSEDQTVGSGFQLGCSELPASNSEIEVFCFILLQYLKCNHLGKDPHARDIQRSEVSLALASLSSTAACRGKRKLKNLTSGLSLQGPNALTHKSPPVRKSGGSLHKGLLFGVPHPNSSH